MQETQKTWGLIPGSGRYPGRGNDNPFQYSCSETEEPGGIQAMELQSDRTQQASQNT